jgi:hypothetical protein
MLFGSAPLPSIRYPDPLQYSQWVSASVSLSPALAALPLVLLFPYTHPMDTASVTLNLVTNGVNCLTIWLNFPT